MAVVASTLTTIAVFLPLVFVEGIAGQLFRDQALTVAIAIAISLAVAMTLIPMLSALKGRPPMAFPEEPPHPQWRPDRRWQRSEEHTSELQSLMRISYAVFCFQKNNKYNNFNHIYYLLSTITQNNRHTSKTNNITTNK